MGMRLLIVTIGTFLVVGLILSTIHFWGLSRDFESFDHPWFHMRTPWIVVPWTLREKAPAEALLWMDIVQSSEQNLFAVEPGFDLGAKKWPDAELSKKGENLKSALEKTSGRNLVLNVLSNAENIDLQISDTVGPSGEGRVLIQSDFDVIMRSLKKLQPLWLFGSSQAERVRFRSFESMWILPATPFKGDVYIGPLQQKNVTLLTEAVARELKRRHKKIIAGPLHTKEEIDLALRLGADGVFIDQPELIGLVSPL
jgi:hypothetical protein